MALNERRGDRNIVSDVLEVDVVGEAPPSMGGDATGSPSWGLPAAIAVFGILALAVVVVVVAPALTRQGAAPPRSQAAATPQPNDQGSELLDVARAALSEWGHFAVTGDVGVLTGHFHPDGPQYRQLQSEAPGIASRGEAGSRYEVKTEAVVQGRRDDSAEIRAQVLWIRAGEADQQLDWIVELRPTPSGRWALWTVRSSEL